MPRLMCMTRLNQLPLDRPVTIEPMQSLPAIKDLITDVSWNFEVKKRIKKFKPRPPDAADGTWRMAQARHRSRAGIPKVHRVFPLPGRLPRPARPSQTRSIYRSALSRLHSGARNASARHGGSDRGIARGAGHRLLQHHEVLHEGLSRRTFTITDNAIIPLKERVVDDYYDPLGWIWKRLRRKP